MKILRRLIFVFSLIFFLGVGLSVLAIFLGLESEPLVVQSERLSVEDLERIKGLIKENDPRKIRVGDRKVLSMSMRDINLFLVHTLSYLPQAERFSGRVNIENGTGEIRLTTTLPQNPIGNYLNLSLSLINRTNKIKTDTLSVGALKLPKYITSSIVKGVHKLLLQRKDYQEFYQATSLVKSVQFSGGNLDLVYEWQPEVVNKLQSHSRDFLLSETDKTRLLTYHQHLVMFMNSSSARTLSLATMLQSFFKFCQGRTLISGDPVSENRALLTVLALYIVGEDVERVTGNSSNRSSAKPQRATVTLRGRKDLAQHFLVSAAIAGSANSNTANVIGLFKEVQDSQSGSGFSFADLAADRAGVKIAEIATSSATTAKQLQQRMAEGVMEDHFMPNITHLPEGIMELEFKRTYGDLDSATYQFVESEIEKRLSQCEIFQIE